MKVSSLQDNLNKGLSIVQRAVPVRTTLPQASHVLMATDQGRLKLVATDLMIATTCWIGATVEEEGSITVPARLLTDFVSSLPNEKVDLSVGDRGRQLHIACARNEANMAGGAADDFPPVPSVEDGLVLKLEPKQFKRAVSQVEFAAAADDTRPVLTGIHTLAEGDELTLAAADGFRLAVHKLPLKQEVAERVEVIIPARALREVVRLIGDDDEPVEMAFNAARSQILFRMKSVELVATLIQGTFPNYSQLIPHSFTTRATIDMKQFLQETRIAGIFARDGAGIVRVQVEPADGASGTLTISARAEEIGNHEGKMDAKVEGESAKIAFNSKYLQDVLSVLDAESVALETTSPSSPGVIRPLGTADSYVHVVMPMFVQW
ncbi:MAG TPA: DNA polymerase III subunit beta [Dehalococcoidia bacterium]|nr:DNA polymerase III subunit beta [Dehalococcoidia bacterium]